MRRSRNLGRLAKESIVYGIPLILKRATGVLTLPLFTYFLEPADYGILNTTAAYRSLIGLIALFGLDSAVQFYFYSKDTEDSRVSTMTTWAAFYLTVTALLFCGILLLREWLSETLLGSAEFSNLVAMSGTLLFLNTAWNVSWNVLRLEGKKWTVSMLAASDALVSTLASLAFVAFTPLGLVGFYLGRIIVGAVFFLLNLWMIRHYLRISEFSISRLWALLVFGLPLVPAAGAYWVVGSVSRVLLSGMSGLSSAGIYSVAASVASCLGLVVGGFKQSWGPFALSIQHDEDAGETYADALLAFICLGGCGVVIVSLLSPSVLTCLTPVAYHSSIGAVPFLASSVVLSGCVYIGTIGATLSKQTMIVTRAAMVAALSQILFACLLIPGYGVLGASIGCLFARFVHVSCIFAMAQRVWYIPYDLRKTGAVCLVTGVIVIAGLSIPHTGLVSGCLLSIVGVIVFAASLLLTGVVTPGRVGRLLRIAMPSRRHTLVSQKPKEV
jgi:O-antigen/teichoic acid export membrane protein